MYVPSGSLIIIPSSSNSISFAASRPAGMSTFVAKVSAERTLLPMAWMIAVLAGSPFGCCGAVALIQEFGMPHGRLVSRGHLAFMRLWSSGTVARSAGEIRGLVVCERKSDRVPADIWYQMSPGTAKQGMFAAWAQAAVIKAPEFSPACRTTTASDKAAIMRFRAGNVNFAAGKEGGNSEIMAEPLWTILENNDLCV